MKVVTGIIVFPFLVLFFLVVFFDLFIMWIMGFKIAIVTRKGGLFRKPYKLKTTYRWFNKLKKERVNE